MNVIDRYLKETDPFVMTIMQDIYSDYYKDELRNLHQISVECWTSAQHMLMLKQAFQDNVVIPLAINDGAIMINSLTITSNHDATYYFLELEIAIKETHHVSTAA